ncbi:MAG TPA: M48 family metalloprotease [Vicinamibacteria bacterium]|nr:M48 family metalloprotease [Vicinamibacteria bacterium]
MKRIVLAVLVVAAHGAWAEEAHDGYAEFRRQGALIVDGQRIRAGVRTKFKGAAEARSFEAVPLGYEVKARGERLSDGTILASEVEAKPNGMAFMEADLVKAFDATEAQYRAQGRVFEEAENGKKTNLGRLEGSGPRVERARSIVRLVCPPYLHPEDFRVYVVENKEWNAMAAPNRSIYVFSGLLEAMDDDEVAIVLGHELAHATHEHSRRAFKKQIFVMLGASVLVAAGGEIDDDAKRVGAQLGTMLVASALTSGYGRSQEDQADRVGLRYAYEGGYAVERGPGLWEKFAQKYGDQNKAVNFFFGDHSVAKDRARNLRREIDWNYR